MRMTRVVSWSAPGRVNLIGEHVDYSDGLVLPFALPFTSTARVTPRTDDEVHVRTTAYDEEAVFSMRVQPGDVSGWAAYVAGVVWALAPPGDTGLDIELHSDVPTGAGLSSSAALECAVAAAVDAALELSLDLTELALRCRRAENDFVGVPSGPMDQLAAMLCQSGHALLIDCRDLSCSDIPLDLGTRGLRLLVVDTGVRHRLADGTYGERRTECASAAAALELESLRDAALDQVRRMADPLLQRRAHHVVSEISRVREVADLLIAGRPEDIGAFMTASHESLRDDYEVSCDELDVAVAAALEAGAWGARMTGGGFGGSAIALCRPGHADGVREAVSSAYSRNDLPVPRFLDGTPGGPASLDHQ
jgi:galactokinase